MPHILVAVFELPVKSRHRYHRIIRILLPHIQHLIFGHGVTQALGAFMIQSCIKHMPDSIMLINMGSPHMRTFIVMRWVGADHGIACEPGVEIFRHGVSKPRLVTPPEARRFRHTGDVKTVKPFSRLNHTKIGQPVIPRSISFFKAVFFGSHPWGEITRSSHETIRQFLRLQRGDVPQVFFLNSVPAHVFHDFILTNENMFF